MAFDLIVAPQNCVNVKVDSFSKLKFLLSYGWIFIARMCGPFHSKTSGDHWTLKTLILVISSFNCLFCAIKLNELNKLCMKCAGENSEI